MDRLYGVTERLILVVVVEGGDQERGGGQRGGGQALPHGLLGEGVEARR